MVFYASINFFNSVPWCWGILKAIDIKLEVNEKVIRILGEAETMSGEEGRPFWTADQVSAGGVWKISPIDLKLNVCRTISWR